jgi:hypothetical protein
MIRYATVKNARDIAEARAYLPGNYQVVWEYEEDGLRHGTTKPVFVIEGTDDHGWGLDSYVIPRYASGLIWANEIELAVCALCGMGAGYHGADMHSFAPRPPVDDRVPA